MPCPTSLCDGQVVAKRDDIGATNPNFTEQIKFRLFNRNIQHRSQDADFYHKTQDAPPPCRVTWAGQYIFFLEVQVYMIKCNHYKPSLCAQSSVMEDE